MMTSIAEEDVNQQIKTIEEVPEQATSIEEVPEQAAL